MLQPLPVAWNSVEFSPERSGQNDSAYKNGIGIDTRDDQHLRLPWPIPMRYDLETWLPSYIMLLCSIIYIYIYILPEKWCTRLDYIRRISAKTRFPACIGSYIRSCLVQEPLEISKGLPQSGTVTHGFGRPAPFLLETLRIWDASNIQPPTQVKASFPATASLSLPVTSAKRWFHSVTHLSAETENWTSTVDRPQEMGLDQPILGVGIQKHRSWTMKRQTLKISPELWPSPIQEDWTK